MEIASGVEAPRYKNHTRQGAPGCEAVVAAYDVTAVLRQKDKCCFYGTLLESWRSGLLGRALGRSSLGFLGQRTEKSNASLFPLIELSQNEGFSNLFNGLHSM